MSKDSEKLVNGHSYFGSKDASVTELVLCCAGLSYDWDREFSTTDPEYYKWTQWIFLQLHKRGLAYQAEVPVNWCPELGTVLANEEVIDGKSERGGFPVVRMPMRQVQPLLLILSDYCNHLQSLDVPDMKSAFAAFYRNQWDGKKRFSANKAAG